MPSFAFEALDSSNRVVKETVEAGSMEEARAMLRKKKLRPISISQRKVAKKKKNKSPAAAAGGSDRKKTAAMGGVNNAQLTMFTRQFATLIEAGLPIVRALTILEEMLPGGVLRNSLMDVRDDVEQGSSLSEAMAKQPKAFDVLYVSMVRAGEMGGVLDTIFNRLADFREKAQKLKKQIISALVYPAAVITIAGGILMLIIMFIIPKFKKMFDGMGVPLPGPTLLLMNFAEILLAYWYLLPGIPFVAFVTWKITRATKGGVYATDLMSLYIPVFGQIIRKTAISRFCRTLGTLTSSGVPIMDALNILKTAVGNAVVEDAVNEVHNSIREGENIADPLKRSGVFDFLAVNMIAVGEETGELDKMLLKVSDNYDNDIDALVGALMSLIEPFLIIGMGGAVAFIVISLFMPLISIIENIGG